MGLAHKSRSAPAWSISVQVPTCKDASLRFMGTILSPSARVTLKILWKVCNFRWFSNWGNQAWGLQNTSNHQADSYSHSAYRSTSYEITSWLPRRNRAGFLNWGLARRSTFHVGLMDGSWWQKTISQWNIHSSRDTPRDYCHTHRLSNATAEQEME